MKELDDRLLDISIAIQEKRILFTCYISILVLLCRHLFTVGVRKWSDLVTVNLIFCFTFNLKKVGNFNRN